jgi:hypothetical protein
LYQAIVGVKGNERADKLVGRLISDGRAIDYADILQAFREA